MAHREPGDAPFALARDQATDDGRFGARSPRRTWIRTRLPALYRSHSGIGPRLLASVLLFSSAVTLLLTSLELYLDYRRDVGTIERRMSEIGNSYVGSLGEGLWELDPQQLQLQVDGILHRPAIRFVEVREATDRPDPMIVSAGDRDAGAAVRREFPLFHNFHGTEQQLGVLSIGATLDDVYRELVDKTMVILVSQGAKTFVVSFFILFIVHRLITRHLGAIARFLSGYDVRRPPPPLRLNRHPSQRPDELDELVTAFNGMSTSLQTAYGELRDSEQRFRDYTETASDWLWATDREHRFTFFSEQSGAFGYDWARPIGKRRWGLAADFARETGKWREHIAALERHEPFREFVYEARRSDGSLGIVSASGKPVFDREGRFSGYRGVASDLTDRRRAEHALRRSEAYLAEAQRLSRTGSWAWNVAPREITHWSQEMFRLYGFDAEAGIPPLDVLQQRIHLQDRTELAEAAERAIRDGAEYELDFRLVLPDVGTRYIHTIGHPVYDDSGNTVEFVGTDMDITERRRAEMEIRESEQRYRGIEMQLAHANRVATMGQLSASIAHEVNQPIAATLTNAHAALRWLSGQPPDLGEVQQALARILRDGTRAGEVIDRVRGLTKKASPRQDLVRINEAILEVIALTRAEAVKNGVSVKSRLAEGLSPIQGDRVQLQQVILNLIINAFEAMSGAGEGPRELLISSVKADGDGGGVLVTVRDSGPGLAPSTIEHLFEAFYTTKPGGLGMGLSICRSIVEVHNGRLWATPNVPRGALFQFTVPASPDAAR
jgi:PAS domain S-box-containing protein